LINFVGLRQVFGKSQVSSFHPFNFQRSQKKLQPETEATKTLNHHELSTSEKNWENIIILLVDGSEIRLYNQLRLVVYPVIY